jgi:hypothetical protein
MHIASPQRLGQIAETCGTRFAENSNLTKAKVTEKSNKSNQTNVQLKCGKAEFGKCQK